MNIPNHNTFHESVFFTDSLCYLLSPDFASFTIITFRRLPCLSLLTSSWISINSKTSPERMSTSGSLGKAEYYLSILKKPPGALIVIWHSTGSLSFLHSCIAVLASSLLLWLDRTNWPRFSIALRRAICSGVSFLSSFSSPLMAVALNA